MYIKISMSSYLPNGVYLCTNMRYFIYIFEYYVLSHSIPCLLNESFPRDLIRPSNRFRSDQILLNFRQTHEIPLAS